MKTMLNLKIDQQLKVQAQLVSQNLGLPLSTVITNFLKDFIHEKRVVFTDHPMPNTQTQALLKKSLQEIREQKTKSFKEEKDLDDYLLSL